MIYNNENKEYTFVKLDLFDNVRAEINRISSVPAKDVVIPEITDSDQGAVFRYLSIGLVDVVSLLSSFLSVPFENSSIDNTSIRLKIIFSENMNRSMILPLGTYIEEYLIQYAISKWLKTEFKQRDELIVKILTSIRFETSNPQASVEVVFNEGLSTWEIVVNKQFIINNARSEISRLAISDKTYLSMIVTNNDTQKITNMFMLGLYDIVKILSPYLVREFSDYEIEDESITLSLKGYYNKDNGISHVLSGYIDEYLKTSLVERWMNVFPGKSSSIKSDIISCLNHRKGSVARTLRPIL